MHRRRHAGRLQFLLHRVAVIHTHGVLRPGAHVVRFDVGRGVDAGFLEQAVVVGGDLLAQLNLLGQDLELGQQDGGLQGVEAAIHAHADVVVAAVLAVAGDLPDDLGELVVVGEDGTAVAVAAQRLAREEAGAGDGAEVARHAALVAGAEALRGVFDDRDAVFGGDGVDGVEVGALAVQAHRDDGAGLGRDGGFEQRRVEVVGARVDIDIHRLGAEHGDGFGGGDVGEARSDDLVAVGHADRHLGDLQGVGAVGAGDAVLGADEGGELFFQLGHFGAEDVLAVAQDGFDALFELRADAALLLGKIGEGHRTLADRRRRVKPGQCGGGRERFAHAQGVERFVERDDDHPGALQATGAGCDLGVFEIARGAVSVRLLEAEHGAHLHAVQQLRHEPTHRGAGSSGLGPQGLEALQGDELEGGQRAGTHPQRGARVGGLLEELCGGVGVDVGVEPHVDDDADVEDEMPISHGACPPTPGHEDHAARPCRAADWRRIAVGRAPGTGCP